jgi:hypothetical protein
LLINDLLEHIELEVYFLVDFVLQTFLIENSLLHISALGKVRRAHVVYLLQKGNLFGRCLLESKSSSPLSLLLEVAVIAKGSVEGAWVNLEFIFVLTEFDPLVLY